MNKFEFNVYPNITVSKKIVRAEVSIVELKLFESARIAVMLYDEDNRVQKVHQLMLDQTNGYNDWLNDKWLLDWVKTQINTL